MRVHVYAEEVTDEVVLVRKKADGLVFIGVRFALDREGDGETGAVTFWCEDGARSILREALREAIRLLDDGAAHG
jgi:hypothetical protein